MKLTGIATTLLLISACSSGTKHTDTPKPDPMAGSAGDPGMPKTDPVPEKAPPAKPAAPPAPDTGGYTRTAPSGLTFVPMDPKATTPGPELAVVHGDPQKGGAWFLKLPPGANSGLHTHTSDYSALVISGAPRHWLAGDDGKKAKILAPGSFWFQPGGQPHGDECTSKEPCVLFLVMPGALDFAPALKAKKGPVGKYSLTARKDVKFGPVDPKDPNGLKVAILSGDPKTGPVAVMLEVPAGASPGLHSHTSDYHAIVVDGSPMHWLPSDAGEGEAEAAGTYLFQPGGYDHGDHCTGTTPCHLYIYMDKQFDMKPAAKK